MRQQKRSGLQVAAIVWLVGVLLVAGRRILEGFRLARALRQASAPPAVVKWRATRLAREIGLWTPFVIRLDGKARMPLVWWCGRWAVLLPAAFPTWSAAEQDTVLVHELMHIKRRDAWTDLLAQGACCVYWFHPLIWWAAAQVRRLREQAADDLVLQSGVVLDHQYARHLVDVVARCPGLVRSGVAMARPHELEHRVRRIVGGLWQQRTPRLATSAAIVATMLLSVGILATADVGRAAGPVADEASARDQSARSNERGPVTIDRQPILWPAGGDPFPAIAHVSTAGRVVDAENRPVAGVRVLLRAWSNGLDSSVGVIYVDDVLAEIRTDREGRFRFDRVPLLSDKRTILEKIQERAEGLDVVAVTDDQGIAWSHLHSLITEQDQVLRLPGTAELAGTVQDESGKPVPGAEILVIGMSRLGEPLDPFLQGPNDLSLIRSQLRITTTTDEQGNFRLPMPQGMRVHLSIQHTSYARRSVLVSSDPTTQPTTLKPAELRDHGQQELLVTPATIQLDGRNSYPVRVRVAGADGQPVTEGRLALVKRGERATFVNEAGIAALAVPEPGECYVVYRPAIGEAGLVLSGRIEVADTSTPQEFELQLPESRSLEGRVIDGAAEGIAGVELRWSTEREEGGYVSATTVTRADGRFQIVAAAGKGRLSVVEGPAGFFVPTAHDRRNLDDEQLTPVVRHVEIPADDSLPPVEIRLPRGLVVNGTVSDNDGNPAVGARITAQPMEPFVRPWRVSARSDERGHFELAGLHPQAGYVLYVAKQGGVAVEEIPAAPEQPMGEARLVELDVRLEPAVTLVGRIYLLDEPAEGVPVQLIVVRQNGPDSWRVHPVDQTETDEEGHYRLSGLQPGDRYQVEIKPTTPVVDPRWHHASPYSQTLPADAEGEFSLPDMHLVPMTQSLSGVVVDPDGNPVAGATVSAQLEDGGMLTSPPVGPRPWTETDEQGRFRLEQLPDVRLQLMAYIRPTGPDLRVRYPARVKVERNQQDIRIVLDPSLVRDE